MNTVPDRKKLRREYLSQKAEAYAKAIEGSLLLGAMLLFIVCAPRVIPVAWRTWEEWTWRHYHLLSNGATSLYENMFVSFMAVCLMLMVLTGSVFGLLSIWAARHIRQGVVDVKTLSYVPPVSPSILPAEEVLVRGAEQPSATSETLLRPAPEDTRTPAEQLLRATNGADSEQP